MSAVSLSIHKRFLYDLMCVALRTYLVKLLQLYLFKMSTKRLCKIMRWWIWWIGWPNQKRADSRELAWDSLATSRVVIRLVPLTTSLPGLSRADHGMPVYAKYGLTINTVVAHIFKWWSFGHLSIWWLFEVFVFLGDCWEYCCSQCLYTVYCCLYCLYTHSYCFSLNSSISVAFFNSLCSCSSVVRPLC